MTKRVKRKDFAEIFLPYTNQGKQIWVINRVKQLPYEIVQIAMRLAALNCINLIKGLATSGRYGLEQRILG